MESFKEDMKCGYPLDPQIDRFIHVNKPGKKFVFDKHEWALKDSYSFKKPGDLEGWKKQGPNKVPLPNLKTTRDGLLFETAKSLDPVNLCHIWSPKIYSGNGFLFEVDVRSEQPEGLALLVFLASGFHGQDFVLDHGLAKTGHLGTICEGIIKNYHWEFLRRMPCNRKDLETQLLVKNPYKVGLGSALVPVLETGQWYHLTFVKDGENFTLAINDNVIIEAVDSPFVGQGPSNYSGRLAIRHMQWTRITYRDLNVYLKDEMQVLSEGKGKSSFEEIGFFKDEASYMKYAVNAAKH
jgi:hypothetical protein